MLRFLVCVCGSYMDVVRSPLANVFGLTLGPVLPRHFQDWHSSAQNIDSQRNANVHGKVGRATRRRDIVSRPRLLNLLGIIEVARILHEDHPIQARTRRVEMEAGTLFGETKRDAGY